jgi:hypothetical protein
VIKCKKKPTTLGTIPKSTTSILVAWYRYFNVNEQKFQFELLTIFGPFTTFGLLTIV